MSEWISTEERLPEEKVWVLGFLEYPGAVDGSYVEPVQIVKGITKEEREILREKGDKRGFQYYMGDVVDGVNALPYEWQGTGSAKYCGSSIIAWMPMPKPFKEPTFTITKKCVCCRKFVRIEVLKESYKKYKKGALIQDAFPDMRIADREFLISGICENCQNDIFIEDDEES